MYLLCARAEVIMEQRSGKLTAHDVRVHLPALLDLVVCQHWPKPCKYTFTV